MMPRPRSDAEYREPPDDALQAARPPVIVSAALIDSTIETLNLLDEFFRRHASSTTRAESAPSSQHKAGIRSKAPKSSSTASASTPAASLAPATRPTPTPGR
jgi:hypothetical protein